ncbi:MAG: hypothetical protein IMW98_08515 [Firmicutes bacterium]|nr:hypothetical protein [Bacillota bacterium]MBE3590848.1 hypothetical protein [Bacillota bacterium]
MSKRPYVIYPPDYERTRARAYATLEAAERAARKIANETGESVWILRRLSRYHDQPLGFVAPSWKSDQDLRADYDLARAIGLEE